jgi:hypothetical protein
MKLSQHVRRNAQQHSADGSVACPGSPVEQDRSATATPAAAEAPHSPGSPRQRPPSAAALPEHPASALQHAEDPAADVCRHVSPTIDICDHNTQKDWGAELEGFALDVFFAVSSSTANVCLMRDASLAHPLGMKLPMQRLQPAMKSATEAGQGAVESCDDVVKRLLTALQVR